jgi:hypothetical protein
MPKRPSTRLRVIAGLETYTTVARTNEKSYEVRTRSVILLTPFTEEFRS